MTWQAHANLLWIKRPEKLAGPELTGCHGSSGGCIPAQDTGAEGLWGRRAPGGRCGGGRGGSEKPDCPGEGPPASSRELTTYTPRESQQGTHGRRRPGQGVVVRENNGDQQGVSSKFTSGAQDGAPAQKTPPAWRVKRKWGGDEPRASPLRSSGAGHPAGTGPQGKGSELHPGCECEMNKDWPEDPAATVSVAKADKKRTELTLHSSCCPLHSRGGC